MRAFRLLACNIALLIAFVGCGAVREKRAMASPASDDMKRTYEDLHQQLTAQYAHWHDAKDESLRSGYPELLNQMWALVGDWTVAYLETHREASPEEIGHAIEELDPRTECQEYRPRHGYCPLVSQVAVLGEGAVRAYFVGASYPEVGSFFFIVPSTANHFRVAWRLRDAAARRLEVGCWTNLPGSHCPFTMEQLPETASGHPRFYIDAEEPADWGMTIEKHAGIWEWAGREAVPLLVGSYDFMIDPQSTLTGVGFTDGVLGIPIKDRFKTMQTCGGCEEPQAVWKIRVTPNEVIDLGKEHLVPELRLADELNYRVALGQPANELASGAALRKVKHLLLRARAGVPEDAHPEDLGVLVTWSIRRDGNRTVLCIAPTEWQDIFGSRRRWLAKERPTWQATCHA